MLPQLHQRDEQGDASRGNAYSGVFYHAKPDVDCTKGMTYPLREEPPRTVPHDGCRDRACRYADVRQSIHRSAAVRQHVGRELGVRYVVEGSVCKAGNRIRISAQLIDAAWMPHGCRGAAGRCRSVPPSNR